MAAFEELGEWSERDSSSSSSQSWKGGKIFAHNVDMPLSMISSSSFSSCNLLRGIPQRPQKIMMVPTTYICPVSRTWQRTERNSHRICALFRVLHPSSSSDNSSQLVCSSPPPHSLHFSGFSAESSSYAVAIDKLLLVSFSLSLHQELNISSLLSFAGGF